MVAVEGNELCIAPYDIVVHNADLAVASVAPVFLEYVVYAHPVVALAGSTIALARVAYRAYEFYRQQRNESQASDDAIPAEVFLAERYYYEQRKKEL
jgi:hypothetical protein